MPEAAEAALKAEAARKGLTGKRKNAYVYGTLKKMAQEKTEARANDRRADSGR